MLYKTNFTARVMYNDELNRAYKMPRFIKKHVILIVLLILLGFTIVYAYYHEKCSNVTELNHFDLVSVIVTYVSSIVLSIVVY